MNIRRFLSYLVVVILATVLWTTWNKEHPAESKSQLSTATEESSAAPASGTSFAPPTFNPDDQTQKPATAAVTPEATQAQLSTAQFVDVQTDTLNMRISLDGGNVISTELLKYPVSVTDKTPVKILSSQPEDLYKAESGLTNTSTDGKSATVVYQSSQNLYTLLPSEKQLVVSLKAKTANGLEITKNFIFERNSYAVKVAYDIKNTSANSWSGSMYTQLVRKKPESESHLFYARSYDGAAVSSPSRPYYKLNYDDMDKAAFNLTNPGGWVAMQQHYFLSAWVPMNTQLVNQFYSTVKTSASGHRIYTIGFAGSALTVPAGQSGTIAATLYVGPEIAENLNVLAPGLDRTIDYGWLWWISIAIFWLMTGVNYVVHNWGWTIVITTILIKFVLYPLSATSFRSMAKMRELQPKMQQLKERFADDRQAMSRATMELYRNEKINPLGGCLPMLIQIPIFIALYYVIIESVQFRQAPFIFWIQDLSIKDPYYVLPILMGISMLIQQKLSPSSPDPVQAKMMMFIPVVFTIFFVNFPAGLTLYWLVNNCVQILQQWYVTKTFEAHKAKKAHKAKAKKKDRSYNIMKK